MTTPSQERRHFDRRISPAIGQHAILECARLRASNAELVKACQAAVHALRSYQYGNSATDLAEETANACESAIAKAEQPAEWQPHLPDPDPEYRS